MHLVQVSQADVKLFFESICGEVGDLSLQTSFSYYIIYTAAALKMQFKEHVHSLSAISLLQVYRLRLLGDYQHNTRIAFVEFVMVRIASPVSIFPKSSKYTSLLHF
jgi:hypothetical protein